MDGAVGTCGGRKHEWGIQKSILWAGGRRALKKCLGREQGSGERSHWVPDCLVRIPLPLLPLKASHIPRCNAFSASAQCRWVSDDNSLLATRECYGLGWPATDSEQKWAQPTAKRPVLWENRLCSPPAPPTIFLARLFTCSPFASYFHTDTHTNILRSAHIQTNTVTYKDFYLSGLLLSAPVPTPHTPTNSLNKHDTDPLGSQNRGRTRPPARRAERQASRAKQGPVPCCYC